jgi:hypothetical protein
MVVVTIVINALFDFMESIVEGTIIKVNLEIQESLLISLVISVVPYGFLFEP